MTDPFFGPLVEALEYYSNPENFIFMNEYGILEYGESNIHLQCTKVIGYKAKQTLCSLDPAPVLRVLRAAWEHFKEEELDDNGYGVRCVCSICESCRALLKVPAYREWLEGVE